MVIIRFHFSSPDRCFTFSSFPLVTCSSFPLVTCSSFLLVDDLLSHPFLVDKYSLSLFPLPKIAFLSSVLSRGTRSAEKRPQPRTRSQRELVGNPRDVRDSANTGSVTVARVVHPGRHGVKG